jgi:opacity protein-like surface antigen
MASMKAILIAGAFVVGTGNLASAADLLPLPPPPPLEAPPIPISGWYLRGDVGVGIASINNLSSSFAPGFVVGGDEFNAATLGDSTFLDLGAGYQFNNWFRADVTGEYRTSAHFSAIESYTSFCAFARCYDDYSASVGSAVGLANGYFDLGTWFGITPFVGGGVGFDYTTIAGLTDIGANSGGFGFAPTRSTTNFAWAAMAGLSYSVTPNLKLEIGYRYLDLGDPGSGSIVCTNTPACGYEVQKFHMTSNDVRLGMRWIFAEVPPLAPPLVTKY